MDTATAPINLRYEDIEPGKEFESACEGEDRDGADEQPASGLRRAASPGSGHEYAVGHE